MLDPSALPTIFPNTPSYLSSPLPMKRKAPEDRRAEITARDDELLEQFLVSDCIDDFDDFRANVQEKSSNGQLQSEWHIVSKAEVVLFVLFFFHSRLKTHLFHKSFPP